MHCPNIKHEDFKALESVYGFNYALYLYDQNGQEIPTLDQAKNIIKNNRSNDPLFNEALMSSDNELSNFIMETLQKNFPGIEIFKSKEDFQNFINKHSENPEKVDIDTIGNAFQNAIYLDEDNAVQSTYFHENAHIYWDAMPENGIKKQLRELFKDSGITQNEIDEAIIRNIGISGVSIAEIELRGTAIEKFEALLKQFWAEIKKLLGIASQKDLVKIVANNMWTNKDKFNQKSFTSDIIRNMKMNPLKINQDDVTHAFMHGDEMWTSVSRAIGMLSTFNQDEAANAMYERMLNDKKNNDDNNSELVGTFEEKEKFVKMIKNQWKLQAEVGTSIHSIANAIVNEIPFDQIGNITVNESTGSKVKDYFDEEVLIQTYDKINRIITNMKNKGYKVYSEVIVGSLKHRMGGVLDIILEKDKELAVLDFKSFFKEDRSSVNTGRYMKYPLENILDTKENKHQLQVDIYANMLESQENKDVKFTGIIPMVYDMENGKVVKFDAEGAKTKVVRRKGRKDSIKDKNRNNADKVMNHVNTINKVREQVIMSDEDIEKIAKERKIDPEILREEREAIIKLSNMLGNIQNISTESIETLLGTGVSFMAEKMINSFGYTYEEIFGNEKEGTAPMSAKDFILRYVQNIEIEGEERATSSPKESKVDMGYFKANVFNKENIDFGTNNEEEAYKRYTAELKAIEDVYESLGDVDGINNIKQNKLDSYYRKVINMVTEDGKVLKQFFEDLIVSRMLTEKIREENSPNYSGLKYATMFIAKYHSSPNYVFRGFDGQFLKSFNFKNAMNIDNRHVLVQLLEIELMNQHRATVQYSVSLSNTLSKYVNDSDDNGRSKNKSERKPLKNEDFEAIIYTDKKTGLTYFQIPSKVRAILEEKYGEEDPRPRNMAHYISTISNVMIANDDTLKSIARFKQPNILVPELQQTGWETLAELNGKNKIHLGTVRRLFSIKEYDNTFINYNNERKRFIDIKQEIYARLSDKNDNGESISSELDEMERIDNIAARNVEKKEKTSKRKGVYILGKQTGRTTLKSKNYNASIHEYLISVVESKRMEKTIPLAEFTKKKYEDSKVKTMVQFLDNEISQKIYKNIDDPAGRGKIGNFLSALIAWTAMKALGFGVLSNITNRAMGMNWNIISHPETMLKSYKRRFTNFGGDRNALDIVGGFDQLRKLRGIMTGINVGTIMQDATFSKYKNVLDKINEWGFKPLEITEAYNQGELLRGILTEKEYLAYNENGNPYRIYQGEKLDPDVDRSKWVRKDQIEWERKWNKSTLHPDAISNNRANEISSILSGVHGYFGFNKSQWSYYKFGQMIGMFTLSWAQSAVEKVYIENKQGWRKGKIGLSASATTNTFGRQRAGMVNSLLLNTKILAYNLFKSTSSKKEEIEMLNEVYYGQSGFPTRRDAEAELYKLDKYADPKNYIVEKTVNGKKSYFIPGLRMDLTDFEKILLRKSKKEGDTPSKIKLSEIDLIHRQNMIRMLIFTTIQVGIALAHAAIKDDDDDIIYGEEYEMGEDGERRGVPKSISELTKDERIKHYVLSFIDKRLLMAGEDATFFINPEFYLRYFQSAPPAFEMVLSGIDAGVSAFDALVDDPKGYNKKPTLTKGYLEPKYIDKVVGLIPYLAQPIRVGESIYRFSTDAVYEEDLNRRADQRVSAYAEKVLPTIAASKAKAGEKVNLDKLRQERFTPELLANLKEAFMQKEMYGDIINAKLKNNEEIKEFLDYMKIYKEIEAENEMDFLRSLNKKK